MFNPAASFLTVIQDVMRRFPLNHTLPRINSLIIPHLRLSIRNTFHLLGVLKCLLGGKYENMTRPFGIRISTTKRTFAKTKRRTSRHGTFCRMRYDGYAHAEESISDSYQFNPNQIVFTIFRLIWNQAKFHLVHNQSKNGIYKLSSVN